MSIEQAVVQLTTQQMNDLIYEKAFLLVISMSAGILGWISGIRARDEYIKVAWFILGVAGTIGTLLFFTQLIRLIMSVR